MSLKLRITQCSAEARDVVLLTFGSADGRPLPAAEPGSHLEIRLPNGLIRQYSLCGDSDDTTCYTVAVGRVTPGRGGSEYIHRHFRVGTELADIRIRNSFPMTGEARRLRFIAGGIGITPIMSMVRRCVSRGLPWSLLYCARSRNRAAFYESLREFPDAVRFHFDEEADRQVADLEAALREPREGEHLYCCGPAGLMGAVRERSAHWPDGTVHFEWFSAPADSSPVDARKTFVAILKRSGMRVHVGPQQSLLEALEQCGVLVPFSCREGLCRTCETPLCGGEAEHLDHVLSEAEKAGQRSIIPCVSRARSDVLVLDL